MSITATDAVFVSIVSVPKRLNVFERFLTVWVGVCMVIGILAGNPSYCW